MERWHEIEKWILKIFAFKLSVGASVSCLGIVPGLPQLGWSFCAFLVHSSFEVREGHFLMLGGVSTSPVPHVLCEQGMGCHNKKGSLWTPCALAPGEIAVFSADLAQWVLINLEQVHMKWCFQVEVKPMAEDLEIAALVTLFYMWNLLCFSENWPRNGDIWPVSAFYFIYLSGCSPGDRKMPVDVCAGAFQSTSRLSALGRAFLSRPSPKDQGLLCCDENSLSSFLLQGCLAGHNALRALSLSSW